MLVEEVFKYINTKLLNPRFLELVEKWARYNGKEFDIGDIDITVKNRGTFKTVSQIPKINPGVGKLFLDETTDYVTFYDVTEIKNNAVASDFDRRILIAERPKIRDKYYVQSRPPKLYIYAVFDDDKCDDKSSYPYRPSFERLKKDFESGKFTHYSSMIEHSIGEDYKLLTFNEDTDRIRNYSSIENDLRCLETDELSKKLSAHIKPTKRFETQAERDNAHKLSMKKMLAKSKPKKHGKKK
jgi:hypothetical protein